MKFRLFYIPNYSDGEELIFGDYSSEAGAIDTGRLLVSITSFRVVEITDLIKD